MKGLNATAICLIIVMMFGCSHHKAEKTRELQIEGYHWNVQNEAVLDFVNNGKGNPQFFSKNSGSPCVIIIPPGHYESLFGKVTITPVDNGPVLIVDPGVQSFGCNYHVVGN